MQRGRCRHGQRIALVMPDAAGQAQFLGPPQYRYKRESSRWWTVLMGRRRTKPCRPIAARLHARLSGLSDNTFGGGPHILPGSADKQHSGRHLEFDSNHLPARLRSHASAARVDPHPLHETLP